MTLWLPYEMLLVRSLGKSSSKFQKSPSAYTKTIFGSPNGTNKFLKSHCAAWFDVIYFILLADSRINPVMRYRHVKILLDPYRSGMSPGSQKSRNTTSNGVYK